MITTYDPKQILIALGTHKVTGYADDTFVSVEWSGDGITKSVGADGEIVRSLSPDDTARVTITLQHGAETIKVAQDLYDKDKLTGQSLFPFLMKDIRAGDEFSSAEAWVAQPPSPEYAREAGTRELIIDCGHMNSKYHG